VHFAFFFQFSFAMCHLIFSGLIQIVLDGTGSAAFSNGAAVLESK